MAMRDSGETAQPQETGQGFQAAAASPPVGQRLARYRYPNITLVDLGKDMSDALRASWTKSQRPFQTGGVMDTTWLPPIVAAGGAGVSRLLSEGTTLAALMDSPGPGEKWLRKKSGAKVAEIVNAINNKFLRKAEIVPIDLDRALFNSQVSVIVSSVASSMEIIQRLSQIERGLGRLSELVERMRQLMEAEDYARFETAAEQIDEITSEFKHHGRFASDVKSRLSLVDRDVNLLRNKYGNLATAEVTSTADARSSVADLNRFYLASLHDIQVDVLQLCLALQDDVSHVEHRQSRLQTKVERYCDDFKQFIQDDRVGVLHRRLKRDLVRSLWNRLPWSARELKAKMRDVAKTRRDFHSARARIERWMDAFESAAGERDQQCVVFCRESDGESKLRAYYTRDLRFQPAEA